MHLRLALLALVGFGSLSALATPTALVLARQNDVVPCEEGVGEPVNAAFDTGK